MFEEKLYRDHAQMLAVDSVVHHSRTRYQDVLIFENSTFGKVLVLDGIVQLTEMDNHIYHEMLAHVPLTAHWRPEDVLIVGGGDGGTLREVLKHPVRRAVVAELDGDVVELAQRHFPDVSGRAFDDPRTQLIIGDAVDFVADTSERFDVIIIDSTDPVGPGEALFSDAFYSGCRSLLRFGGTLGMQSGIPFYQTAQLASLRSRLSDCFGSARPFLSPAPTYASGMLALFVAGRSERSLCPPADLLQERFAKIRPAPRFYSPEVHASAFVMAPTFETTKTCPSRACAVPANI
jgi:spermidine synthase